MSRLSAVLVALICFFAVNSCSWAETDPVAVRLPTKNAWKGQRLNFYVELRVKGSFSGAASFTLPEVPRTNIIQLGSPTVSSEQIDGESWFIQSHEFALFSQRTGELTIPEFDVRFASREGFTGPASDRSERVPAFTVIIQQPPNTADIGFLVTTEKLVINETWQPKPGSAPVGTVYTRTITQSADELVGMALAPPPDLALDGVRVYSKPAEVTDNIARGSISGRRTDTLTYLTQEPGIFSLPAITYSFWEPSAEQLRLVTLPAVSFEAQLSAVEVSAAQSPVKTQDQGVRWLWWSLLAITAVLALWAARNQELVKGWVQGWWNRLYPLEYRAARRLMNACRRNRAKQAMLAWWNWLAASDKELPIGNELTAAVTDLERRFYGTSAATTWQGQELLAAFEQHRKSFGKLKYRHALGDLPPLNPISTMGAEHSPKP